MALDEILITLLNEPHKRGILFEIITRLSTFGSTPLTVRARENGKGDDGVLYTGLGDGRVVALDENGENPRDIFFTGGVVSSVGRDIGSTTGVDYGTRLLSTCHDKVLLCLFVCLCCTNGKCFGCTKTLYSFGLDSSKRSAAQTYALCSLTFPLRTDVRSSFIGHNISLSRDQTSSSFRWMTSGVVSMNRLRRVQESLVWNNSPSLLLCHFLFDSSPFFWR